MLKEIELTYELIEDNFKLDKELIEKYHIEEGNDYKKCCLRTYNDLQKDVDNSFKLYGVFDNNNLIGFFGTEFDNYINTIFVKPEYRNKKYMEFFTNYMFLTVGNEFYTALYTKNKRAIEFYKKLGGKIVKDLNDKNAVLIKVEV